MHKQILITLIESFSLKENKRFTEYLNSPYFNESKILADAYGIFKKYIAPVSIVNENNVNIDSKLERDIFNSLYPNKQFNGNRIRNIFSKLHKEALRFLTYEAFTTSKADHVKYLLNAVNNKRLVNEWEKIINEYEDENPLLIDSNYFLNKHIIETHKFNFSYLNRKVIKLKQAKTDLRYLDNSVLNLLLFFILALVSSYATTRTYTHQYNIIPGNNIIKNLMRNDFINVLKLSISKTDKNYFIIDIYLTIIEMFLDMSNVKIYKRYKFLILNNLVKFSKDEINFHFINLLTYLTIRFNNTGSKTVNKEILEVYKLMLDKEYYLNSAISHLPHEIYRNILFQALQTREFNWANEFIRVYSKKVHPADQRNMECYGYAYLCFHQGRYNESLKHLNEMELNYFIFKFDVKNLTLKLYYELGFTEECIYLIKTYRELLRKNTVISSEKNNRYVNFVKFYEKILLNKDSSDKKEIEYIQYLINKNEPVAFKSWLLEKTSSILSKKSSNA